MHKILRLWLLAMMTICPSGYRTVTCKDPDVVQAKVMCGAGSGGMALCAGCIFVGIGSGGALLLPGLVVGGTGGIILGVTAGEGIRRLYCEAEAIYDDGQKVWWLFVDDEWYYHGLEGEDADKAVPEDPIGCGKNMYKENTGEYAIWSNSHRCRPSQEIREQLPAYRRYHGIPDPQATQEQPGVRKLHD